MKQVAEAAGVAVSTVSRALANPGRVNEKTRQRIAEAARQLGYTPNAAARTLRMGRSNVIMIVLPGPLFYGASQVIPMVLTGIDRELSSLGFNLLIANLDRDEATEQHILDLAGSGTVDGAIVISSQPPSVAGRALGDNGLPVVGILHDVSPLGVPSVITNEFDMMGRVVEALFAEGHRRFFYVAGPADMYHEEVRIAGIRAGLERCNIPAEALSKSEGAVSYQYGFAIGQEAAATYMALTDRPTAVMCCSDDAAISFMSCLLDAGLSIPGEVSVIGFDGSAVGALYRPSLCTIKQPAEEMGRTAARLLLKQLSGENVPLVKMLDSQFLRRNSC